MVFRITKYAQELLDGCDRLTSWPARVLAMQRHWIGRSEGVEIDFPVADPQEDLTAIRIFTTRPDTIHGATFMSLAPESPLVEQLIKGRAEADSVRKFVERVSRLDKATRTAVDREKEGVFTGAYAINPFTQEQIPIWVAILCCMNMVLARLWLCPLMINETLNLLSNITFPFDWSFKIQTARLPLMP